jgi:putative Ca2+/H+ antiporter (TMEM165/GDT1 family)
MDLKLLLRTFGMIFVAGLGDKTELATFSFAAESKSPLTVFLGSAGALVLTSLLAVLLGLGVGRLVPENYIRIMAGGLFILLGIWMILSPGR